MNELFQSVQDQVPHVGPFMMAAGVAAPRMDRNRVMESVISGLAVGAVVAAAGYFVALPKLEQQVQQVTTQITEVKTTVSVVQAKVEIVAERQQRLEGRLEGRAEGVSDRTLRKGDRN